jgi:tRNA threonylcarbamoyladenosine biosynthesis protein TsaB
MNILSIDTSTPIASLALASGEKIIAESVFLADRSLSARLMPEIERMLTLAGMDIGMVGLFACSIGPGSFTGVRAGVATTQGLALATGKPCFGFSTLAMLAMNFPMSAHLVCPLLDARKSEVYAALYDCSQTIPTALIPDSVMSPECFLDQVCNVTGKPVIYVGDGALRYHDTIAARQDKRAIFPAFPYMQGHAAHGALLAMEAQRTGETCEPARLLPVYLRASEAEYAKMNRQTSHAKQ